jgi:1-deoxy-D-xylulose-5-phosphate reductoisomerase
MKTLTILGSTGSIGVQALELVRENPNQFQVTALAAGGNNLELLLAQAVEFKVKKVAVFKGIASAESAKFAEYGIKISSTMEAIIDLASEKVDLVLNGITGSIGLAPSLAALTAGNILALANKESMVAGGELMRPYLNQIIPVDSEHNALYQAIKVGSRKDVNKLILTASGGPFRNRTDLSTVTLAEALDHPTWSMGQYVTINSATLFNKGLEIIEAHYLFDFPYEKIEAVIHPSSMVHSMVEFHDGSTIAHAAPPSMKLPIGYALNGGNHLANSGKSIDWSKKQNWEFEPIDTKKFPSIDLAKTAGNLGQSACATINAANEVALAAFIAGEIGFSSIISLVGTVLEKMANANMLIKINSLADVSGVEENARRMATEEIALNLKGKK